VQMERVSLVFQAQQDLASGRKTGEPAYMPHKTAPQTSTHTRLREKVASHRPEPTITSPTPRDQPPDIAGGELEVETEEDHNRRDIDVLNLPPKLVYDKILFSPETVSLFLNRQATLRPVKQMLQQKELIAKLRYDQRIRKDPNGIEGGAELFSNRLALARNMPESLNEFNSQLIPGVTPVRQRMRRFTAEETQEMRKQVTKMLEAGVIKAETPGRCLAPPAMYMLSPVAGWALAGRPSSVVRSTGCMSMSERHRGTLHVHAVSSCAVDVASQLLPTCKRELAS
jgi:hypothetical protein